MSGYSTYLSYQRIEEQANGMGFRLGNPRRGAWTGSEFGDMVGLYPAEGALPIYTRDAELFVGTFKEVEMFLAGWARSQQYDRMLRMTDNKRRRKFEDAERARQAEQRRREEQKKLVAVLQASDQQNRSVKK